MDRIRIDGNRLVDESGNEWKARGVMMSNVLHQEAYDLACVPETMLYEELERRMGKGKAQEWWDRLAVAMFTDADAIWLKEHGFNCIRLSFHWLCFDKPNVFKAVLDICRDHELYCILDLHSAPGGQNPDSHGDSMGGRAIFWEFDELTHNTAESWGILAQRLSDSGPELLGYELLNEPVTRLCHTRYGWGGENQWDKLGQFYFDTIGEIRCWDKERPILITGDFYSQHWNGLELPDDDQLVLSAHQYLPAALDPSEKPYGAYEATQKIGEAAVWKYADEHSCPILWTEFGAMHLPSAEPSEGQLNTVEQQARHFREFASGWFYWSYKDCMGLLRPVEWEKAFEQLTKTRLMLSADNLGSSLTPPGFIGKVRHDLEEKKAARWAGESHIPYWNNLAIEGMAAVIEKHMRRAAWEGCVHAWGDIIERNPDLVELWKLENCKSNERLLEALNGNTSSVQHGRAAVPGDAGGDKDTATAHDTHGGEGVGQTGI